MKKNVRLISLTQISNKTSSDKKSANVNQLCLLEVEFIILHMLFEEFFLINRNNISIQFKYLNCNINTKKIFVC